MIKPERLHNIATLKETTPKILHRKDYLTPELTPTWS